jgi:hypothetical protein
MNELLRGSVVAIILWAVPVVSFAGDFLYQGRFNTEVKGIFLPVEIQGSTYLFLLDTGATYTTLDGSLRRLLGDPLSLEDIGMKLDRDLTEFRTQTIQGISDLSYFEPIPIKLGELDLADDPLYGIADLQSIWVVSGVQFHGIIGASFLRRFVWHVDFDKGVIEAYQPGTSPHGFQPSIEVPVLWSPRRDVPVVRAKLGDENAAFVIDSADGGSGRVTGPVFNALRDEGHVKSTFEAKAMSAGGEYTTTIFRNSRLGLADKQYPDLVFGVSNQNALGFGFLSRHNLGV